MTRASQPSPRGPLGRHSLVVPDLDLAGIPIYASQWLVEPGCAVTEGDRLLEVSIGSMTVDLPAPASGVLGELLVGEDDELQVGQVVGVIFGGEPGSDEP